MAKVHCSLRVIKLTLLVGFETPLPRSLEWTCLSIKGKKNPQSKVRRPNKTNSGKGSPVLICLGLWERGDGFRESHCEVRKILPTQALPWSAMGGTSLSMGGKNISKLARKEGRIGILPYTEDRYVSGSQLSSGGNRPTPTERRRKGPSEGIPPQKSEN